MSGSRVDESRVDTTVESRGAVTGVKSGHRKDERTEPERGLKVLRLVGHVRVGLPGPRP